MITAAELKAAAEKLLAVAGLFSPQVALATAGVEAITDIYASLHDTKNLLDKIMEETTENAPEVAAEVIGAYKASAAAWDKSAAANPGT